jgi:hypothetical protein
MISDTSGGCDPLRGTRNVRYIQLIHDADHCLISVANFAELKDFSKTDIKAAA